MSLKKIVMTGLAIYGGLTLFKRFQSGGMGAVVG